MSDEQIQTESGVISELQYSNKPNLFLLTIIRLAGAENGLTRSIMLNKGTTLQNGLEVGNEIVWSFRTKNEAGTTVTYSDVVSVIRVRENP